MRETVSVIDIDKLHFVDYLKFIIIYLYFLVDFHLYISRTQTFTL